MTAIVLFLVWRSALFSIYFLMQCERVERCSAATTNNPRGWETCWRTPVSGPVNGLSSTAMREQQQKKNNLNKDHRRSEVSSGDWRFKGEAKTAGTKKGRHSKSRAGFGNSCSSSMTSMGPKNWTSVAAAPLTILSLSTHLLGWGVGCSDKETERERLRFEGLVAVGAIAAAGGSTSAGAGKKLGLRARIDIISLHWSAAQGKKKSCGNICSNFLIVFHLYGLFFLF